MCQLNDSYEHVGFNNGREVIIGEVIVGTVSELPSATFFDGFELHEASRGWDVRFPDLRGARAQALRHPHKSCGLVKEVPINVIHR